MRSENCQALFRFQTKINKQRYIYKIIKQYGYFIKSSFKDKAFTKQLYCKQYKNYLYFRQKQHLKITQQHTMIAMNVNSS